MLSSDTLRFLRWALFPVILLSACNFNGTSQSAATAGSAPLPTAIVTPPPSPTSTPTDPQATPTPTPTLTPTPTPTPTPLNSTCATSTNTSYGISQITAKPQERSIFQRQYNQTGAKALNGYALVTVSGSVNSDAPTCLEFQLRDQANNILNLSTPTNWRQNYKVSFSGRNFTATFAVPAGLSSGHYQFWIRPVFNAVAGNAYLVNQKIGIGEIFVIAGQSNASWNGLDPQNSSSDAVSYYIMNDPTGQTGGTWFSCNDNNFNHAQVDPGLPAFGNTNGGAQWCILGDWLQSSYQIPIGFAMTAWSGTTIAQWTRNGPNPAGAPSSNPGFLQSRLRAILANLATQNGGAGYLLFQQGEGDILQTQNGVYYAGLKDLIQGVRSVPGMQTLPFIPARVSWNPHVSATGQLLDLGGVTNPIITSEQASAASDTSLNIPGLGTSNVFLGPNMDAFNGAYRRYRTATQGCDTVNPAYTAPCVVDAIHFTDVGTDGAANSAYCYLDGSTGKFISPTYQGLGSSTPTYCNGLAASANAWRLDIISNIAARKSVGVPIP